MNAQRKSLLLTQGFIVLALLALLLTSGPVALHGGASPSQSPRSSEGQVAVVLASCQGDNATNVFFSSIPNRWISSPITINCASTGASVTGVDVAARIEHFCPNVVRVELRYGGLTLVLWNKEGGCGDVTYFAPSAMGNSTFNGMPVNGTWELWAMDEEGYGREYYIDYWTIKLYYASPTPTDASFAMLSGRVYEGSTGQEPPNSTPMQGVRVSLYGSTASDPLTGYLLATTYTNSDGWYGLGVTERSWAYYHIKEFNPLGYTSNGATTAPGGGTVTSYDLIRYTAPLWGKTWTGNKFWDEKSVTNTPTPTRTATRRVTETHTATPRVTNTPTRGPSPTPTNTPTRGPTPTPTRGPSPTPTLTPTPDEGTDLMIDKTLIKFSPGPLLPGDLLEYTILVWNHGPTGAANVVMTDTLPTGVGFVGATGNCTVVQAGPPHDIVRCDLGDIPTSPQGNIIWMQVVVDEGACGTLRNIAEVHSDTPDPDLSNNVVQLDLEAGPCGSPDLHLTKTLVDPPGGVANVGETVRFRIEARNLGNTPITGFNLQDTFLEDDYDFVWASAPPSVNTSDGTHHLLVWENLSLPAGGDTAVLLDLVTKRPAVAAKNCAYYIIPSTSGSFGGTFGMDSCVAVQVRPLDGRHISIYKKFTQPSNHVAQLGDWIKFETQWTNVGTDTASAAAVYDHISPPSVSSGFPVMAEVNAPYKTGEYVKVGVTFKPESLASPAINTAEWTTTWPDGTKHTQIAKDYIYITDGQAGKGLFVTKQLMDPIGGATISDTITYRLSITNVTGFDLPVVALSDTFPAQCLSYVGASLPPGGTAPGILEWANVGPLALGDSVHIDVQFHAEGVCPAALNCMRAEYQEPDGAQRFAVDCTPVSIRGERPQLWVLKTLVSPNPATVGDLVVWEIVVENTGAVSLPVVPLHDAYQVAYFDFDSATPAPNSIDLANGRLDWTNLGPLAPGQFKTITVRLIAKAPGIGATNCAESYYTVGSSPFVPSDCATVDIRTEGPGIVVEKIRAWPDPNLPMSVGSHMAFTITVHNPGPVTISNLHVQDFFDASCLAYVHDTAGNTIFPGSGRLRWEFPPLAPGGSLAWEVIFQATCGHITNSVWADGQGPQGHEVHDEDLVEFDIEHRWPDLRIEKRLVDPQHLPAMGEVLRYEIVVRNTGNTILTTVPVDDWFDYDCLKFVSALPGPSTVDTATGQIHWNSVGPLAPGDFRIISVFLRGIGICMSPTYNCARAMWVENGEVKLDDMDCVEVLIVPPGNHLYLPLIVKG